MYTLWGPRAQAMPFVPFLGGVHGWRKESYYVTYIATHLCTCSHQRGWQRVPEFSYREAPGLSPSMSQLSLLLRIRRMVSACSLVKLALLPGAGRFPPLSQKSTMAK